jgi:hypothetical protein
MGNNAKNTVGLRLIQLSSDTYAVQHQCLLAPMKTVKIGEPMLIIYPDTLDPLIYPARLLELWQEGDVLYLKLWNFHKGKWELYTQDLTTESCLFFFVSIPFITKLAKGITDQNIHESWKGNKQNRNNYGQSLTANDPLKDKPELPQPFYNSAGKKILEYISTREIRLDLPFILTKNKKLKLNMPYLKTERKLSGNDITAVRLLNFGASEGIIQLKVQELKNKQTYTIEWNMDYTGSYLLWSLADFETAIGLSKAGNDNN